MTRDDVRGYEPAVVLAARAKDRSGRAASASPMRGSRVI